MTRIRSNATHLDHATSRRFEPGDSGVRTSLVAVSPALGIGKAGFARRSPCFVWHKRRARKPQPGPWVTMPHFLCEPYSSAAPGSRRRRIVRTVTSRAEDSIPPHAEPHYSKWKRRRRQRNEIIAFRDTHLAIISRRPQNKCAGARRRGTPRHPWQWVPGF